MSLSGKDKTVVKSFWDKVAPKAAEIGGEALGRWVFSLIVVFGLVFNHELLNVLFFNPDKLNLVFIF